jgi:hypothetical protein
VSGTGYGLCVVQSEVVGGPGDELCTCSSNGTNGRLGQTIECGLHSVTGGEVANDVGEVLFGGARLLVEGLPRSIVNVAVSGMTLVCPGPKVILPTAARRAP